MRAYPLCDPMSLKEGGHVALMLRGIYLLGNVLRADSGGGIYRFGLVQEE